MANIYVEMIIKERNRLGIPTTMLCDGIFTGDMFYLVEQKKRSIDRITAKRLLARLGVDNGDYEHYLYSDDYEIWKKRMQIINYIEDGKLKEAKELLNTYFACYENEKSKSRAKMERQFHIFMNLQIMRMEEREEYVDRAGALYGEALKMTVPSIDIKGLRNFLLSPLELNLVLEYRCRKSVYRTIEEKQRMYREILEYIDKAPYGKLAQVKIYPKVVVYMYRDVKTSLKEKNMGDVHGIYEELMGYCKRALDIIKDRKMMFYLVEILEMRTEIFSWFKENDTESIDSKDYAKMEAETLVQSKELKDTYTIYCKEPYMVNDCYFYRESGIYCINEVIKIRRKMMRLTQDELCGVDIAVSMLRRVENQKKAFIDKTFKTIFERLKLCPEYVNMGIVTENKHCVELYEELRYAIISLKYDDAKRIISELDDILEKNPNNLQVLERVKSVVEWRMGKISNEQHINNLIHALECTVKLGDIQSGRQIYITTEELKILYLISGMYKEAGEYEKALIYIKEVYDYIKEMEERGLADGRMGIYEIIMTYVASLHGDISKFKASNDISDNLIKLCLKLRRGTQIHSCIYNIAWNNNEAKIRGYDYNSQVQRCINLSRLLGDNYDEKFYQENLITTE